MSRMLGWLASLWLVTGTTAALDLSGHRIVDLTHAYNGQTLYWPTSPSRFELKTLAEGHTPGGWFYSSYAVCTPEHGGTHLDAPRHFAEGGITTEQIPLGQLMAQAVVIDVTAEAARDPDYRLTRQDVIDFESTYGAIPPGSIVLLRTGWSRRWPDAKGYLGDDTPGDASRLSFPSYGEEAARLLVEERNAAALGVDTASIDYGRSKDFRVHQVAAARNVPGLENLTGLDQLPVRGATVIALPMKIEGGSGGPVRVVALVPERASVAVSAPMADKRPFTVLAEAGNREDEYYWLRDDTRSDPDVLAYLQAENAHVDAMLLHTKALQERLYEEIVARIKQDDASVPVLDDGWWYYSRYETGQERPLYARREGSMESPEQVILDLNQLAEGHGFYQVANWEVAPDNRLLAWAEDSVGRRQYSIRFKDLVTGEVLQDRIENAEASLAWAADSKTLLYVEKDPQTLLGLRIRKHVLGTDPAQDALVYEQDDESFYTGVGKTSDDRYLLIVAESTVSSEIRFADASDPELAFSVFLPRERDHEYQADHVDGRWIIRSNWQARNFRLMEVADGQTQDRSAWREVIGHREDAFINDFAVFRDFLAVDERSGGLRKLRIRRWAGGEDYYVDSDDPTYAFELGSNPSVDSTTLRYTYESMTTPLSTFDLDMATGERRLLKREPVLGDFDASRYTSEYLWATARDGTKVPVSLVYHKDTPRDGSAPLYQYAYGSYGYSTDPYFSRTWLSLLDRGFMVAIAHIRGGQEMGRSWYENGKLLAKRNTFNDFVDVTRFLVDNKYADAARVFAQGGSAGGLLMGVIANEAPGDYRGIIAQVPFVDAVTTMLDESIPLTTNEFDEWGNPKDKVYYDYILSYSPYDNVSAQDYPAILVTTGLWDSQVQYFEPAKWVARLRDRKTDQNPLLFRTTMQAGHGGKSGRFERYRELAEVYAFILDQAGITQ